jgi:hypothetical protein
MTLRDPKKVQNTKGLFTLLRLAGGAQINGVTPDGERLFFNRDSVFVPIKPGLMKISHEKAFADDLLVKALFSCEWLPQGNREWHPSPLVHLAFEAPDGEEQACLQVDHRCEGVVHAPEADTVQDLGGLSLERGGEGLLLED